VPASGPTVAGVPPTVVPIRRHYCVDWCRSAGTVATPRSTVRKKLDEELPRAYLGSPCRGPRICRDRCSSRCGRTASSGCPRSVGAARSRALLAVVPLRAFPGAEILARLERVYALKDALDPTWATRPLELVHHSGRPTLLLEDPGGELLARLVGQP
jgi:hypothetical protein